MSATHRPTFDPARGKEAARGPAYHQRLLPAHTHLKVRDPSQIAPTRDLRAELLKAEAASKAKKAGKPIPKDDEAEEQNDESVTIPSKRRLEAGEEEEDESEDVKRRRKILEESRDLDADSVGSSSDDDDEEEESGGGKKKTKADDDDEEEEDDDDEDEDDDDEDSDDSDDMDDLQAELDKIKRERAEARAKEEADKAAVDQEKREFDIARGNPLLNPQDFNVKRRWDDDVVFKNQARGTEERGKQREFVNDLLRSDFHKRFMNRYVR